MGGDRKRDRNCCNVYAEIFRRFTIRLPEQHVLHTHWGKIGTLLPPRLLQSRLTSATSRKYTVHASHIYVYVYSPAHCFSITDDIGVVAAEKY